MSFVFEQRVVYFLLLDRSVPRLSGGLGLWGLLDAGRCGGLFYVAPLFGRLLRLCLFLFLYLFLLRGDFFLAGLSGRFRLLPSGLHDRGPDRRLWRLDHNCRRFFRGRLFRRFFCGRLFCFLLGRLSGFFLWLLFDLVGFFLGLRFGRSLCFGRLVFFLLFLLWLLFLGLFGCRLLFGPGFFGCYFFLGLKVGELFPDEFDLAVLEGRHMRDNGKTKLLELCHDLFA